MQDFTWTGSVVRGPDSLWRMFYTGASFGPDGGNVETIGVATSEDLYEWTKQLGHILRADPRWYETFGTSSWPEEAWRDPWVYQDGDEWHMLITARANAGPDDDRGVIGHATSPDLSRWTVQPPFSVPGAGFAHLEVPQLVDVDGHPVVLFSCNTPAVSQRAQGEGVQGGIWTIAVRSPLETIDVTAAQLLTPEFLHSGRFTSNRNGETVMLAFDMADAHGEFLGSISDPMRITWDDEGQTPHTAADETSRR